MINAVTYSERHDYDAYGIRMTSTNFFAVLTQNDTLPYAISMVPFGPNYICQHNYSDSNYFIISIAVGRRQNFSQLSFVYLSTSATDGQYQKRYVSTDQFDYVLSVSIHDSTQQLLVGVPQLRKTYLFSFNSTNLTLINTLDHPVRSTSWLDDAGLLLSDTTTLPWTKSRTQAINVSSNDIITPPTFIRLTRTYDYQLVVLTTDGVVVLIPSTDAGYHRTTDDISNPLKLPIVCPLGTYESVSGSTPCKIWPSMTKSSSISKEYLVVLKVRLLILTLDCIACSSDSFVLWLLSAIFLFGTAFRINYPIETSTDTYFACDTSLRNTQFSSALQLSATIKSNKETPIFDMFDTQEFIMIVNFLQTGYTRNDVTAQDHTTLVVCLSVLLVLSSAINNSSCLVQNLDYCHLYSTSNQTLDQTTAINFDLTKVINQTELLYYSGSTNYSGIWILTSIHESLNDYLVYLQRGAFLRYLYTKHAIMITFSETKFDVINKQEPTARRDDIIFHNILFTTTVIGIFALAFLVVKLRLVSTVKWMIKHENFVLPFSNLRKDRPTRRDGRFLNLFS
ncbi:unnamed protein product [Rotaria magnacalcarata]|uniref:Uncharacterized protein n=2 Tax=Rotaria magnacalcarata TaxID=392030 RepID=A0A816F7F2_9BILA|nr:unnamed protein product [Rotaria magnacalcarata]